MEEAVTFKPIIWRLTLWKFVPFYVGWTTVMMINNAIKHYSYFPLLETTIVLFIMSIIFSIILRKKFDIVISKSKINGPGTGMILNSESFSVTGLDMSTLHKQSFYEKIQGFRTLRSIKGQKIMLANFIYGKSAVNEIYKTLEQRHSQFSNQ